MFRAIGSATLIVLQSVSFAGAQEEGSAAPEEREDMDEMTVLASGRDDFLKDMSVSVTTFSSSEIQSLRIQNIADLAGYTPNLEINTRSSASNPTLFIRGIGLKDYNANAASAVSVYQDGININSPAIQLGQLFDTESISVVRGPQGGVNGRNATAGSILINSVLPDGELDAYASVSRGNYHSLNTEGALSFPLIDELLSARVAFTANFRDGTTTNNCADWDPRTVGSAVLTEESIRAAWEAYRTSPGFGGVPVSGRFPRRLENGRTAAAGEVDSEGRILKPDKVCVNADPGSLSFPDNDSLNAVWRPNNDLSTVTLEDFQGLKKNVNDVNNWAGRVILRFQPDVGDGMDWVLNVHGSQSLADSYRLQSLRAELLLGQGGSSEPNPSFQETKDSVSDVRAGLLSGLEGSRVVNGILPRSRSSDPGGLGGDDVDSGFYNGNGDERLSAYGANLRGTWDTGPVLLTSITGWERYIRRIEDEGDALPTAAFPGIYDDDAWQLSQELRAEGEIGRHSWTAGGYILYENLEAANVFPGIRGRSIEQFFTQELASIGIYAGGRYWLHDEIYLDTGIRFNQERKEFGLQSTVKALEGGQNIAIPKEDVTESWETGTGELTLAWEPGGDWMYTARLDSLNLYAKYARGFKSGHFNAGLTLQPAGRATQRLDPVAPEYVDSIEFGFKSFWLQDRLSVHFAFFRYWYQDLQVFDFENQKGEIPIQKLLNADASVLGAELEIRATPIRGLELQLAGGWLDSEFKEFVVEKFISNPRGVSVQPPARFNYKGNPLIAAPELSLSGLAEYSIRFFHLGTLVPHYDFRFRSKVYLDPQARDPISQEAFMVHNARLSYRTRDGRIEVAAWVENFMDKRYKIDVFDLTIDQETILEVWNEPRMYGLTLTIAL